MNVFSPFYLAKLKNVARITKVSGKIALCLVSSVEWKNYGKRSCKKGERNGIDYIAQKRKRHAVVAK